MREVLRLTRYRRLLAAYTLNEVGFGVGSLTLAVLVYRRTGSAVGAMSYFLAAQFVPALLAPWVVARVDRRPPRVVLGATYAAEAVLFALLAWLAGHFVLASVLIVTVVDGVLALAGRPLVRAAIAAVTGPAGRLREGNSLLAVAFSASMMLGPAIGGAVVALGGTSLALAIDAALLALVAITLASGSLPRGGEAAAGVPDAGRLRAALRYATGRRAVRGLLTLQAVGVVFFTISLPVDVVFVEHTFHRGAGSYGALLAVWGAGAVLGSAAYARGRRWTGRGLIALGAAALGCGFLVMAVAPTFAVAVIGSAIGGAGNGLWGVAALTALQEAVEGEWMAIVLSLSESLLQASPGAGIALGGALAALAGARVALAVGGVGTLLVAAVTVPLLGPRRRGRLAA